MTDKPTCLVNDQLVGRNLHRLRDRANISMSDLAEDMNERGYKWTKTTVFKIEQGVRRLRYSEAADALECLGRDVSEMSLLLVSDDVHELREATCLVDGLHDMLIDDLQRLMSAVHVVRAMLSSEDVKDVQTIALAEAALKAVETEALSDELASVLHRLQGADGR